jgi:membrane protease YdiL (CAAX protease family)
VLGILGFFASFLVIPYSIALTSPETVSALGGSENMLMAMSIVGQACTGGLLFPLIALGLLAANQIGMGAPILEGLLNRQPVRGFAGKALLWGFVSGIAGGAVLILISFLTNPLITAEYERLGQEIPNIQAPAPWMGFLASISAGITEEIMLRLFLLSGLAWIGSKIWRTADGRPRRFVFWAANVLSALAFGLLHFPLAASLDMTTTLALLNTLLMNAFLGLVFGWLYDKYGLESAMMGHFSTDLVLHVLLPLLGI